MNCFFEPYTLPTIDFVGGETQDLAFNVYFYKDKKPFSLTGCTCKFSVVSFTNKMGVPIIEKDMAAITGDDSGSFFSTDELEAIEALRDAAATGYTVSLQTALKIAKVYYGVTAGSTITKDDEILLDKDIVDSFLLSVSSQYNNVLTVKLLPTDTVDLFGKYIYQIIIRDIDGDVEIPKQGILYVTNNINKNFIRQ